MLGACDFGRETAMRNARYILTPEGNPVAEPDLLRWAAWYETAQRKVADTRVGEVRISTVFLGLDHQFDEGTPILWETMVFGGTLNEEQDRCGGSREQAEAMHAAMVARVEAAP
jgi:hypothetical protein